MRFSKTLRGPKRPAIYNFQEDWRDPENGIIHDHIYEESKFHEEQEAFDLVSLEPETQLNQIAKHIKLRIKITQYEIFKIGELLTMAKKICRENKMGFKEWIDQNFDISYETANNFMNVFKQCFGQRKVALKIPPTILYKVSAPNFPEELREYLFERANFNELTNGKLANLKKRYDEGGLEAIIDDIEEINRATIVERQLKRRFDLVENYLRHLYEIIQKYKNDYTGNEVVEFELQLESLEPEAKKITKGLYQALETSYIELESSLKDVSKEYSDFIGQVKKRM